MDKHSTAFSQAMSYLVECMRLEARHSASGFFLVVLIAIALGGLCWFAATQYTKLWNLHYNATLTLHTLCGFAALLTLMFTIAFVSLDYAKQVAQTALNRWYQSISADRKFLNDTYVDAYYAVQRSGYERFDPVKHLPPSDPNSRMPFTKRETKVLVGKLYADASLTHFRRTNPYLSRVIMPGNQDVPASVIFTDINEYFAAHRTDKVPPVYFLDRGVKIAANLFRQNLETQTPKVVSSARRWITMLFLTVQLIPFGLIGVSAYLDLKTTT
jgi:hypothetical protein